MHKMQQLAEAADVGKMAYEGECHVRESGDEHVVGDDARMTYRPQQALVPRTRRSAWT
jgi:hypothetical protein